MDIFKLHVQIDAENYTEAREILVAMVDIMKTIRKETSTQEFIEFGEKLKEKPALVHMAKMFADGNTTGK